jgi:hypothetical protein
MVTYRNHGFVESGNALARHAIEYWRRVQCPNGMYIFAGRRESHYLRKAVAACEDLDQNLGRARKKTLGGHAGRELCNGGALETAGLVVRSALALVECTEGVEETRMEERNWVQSGRFENLQGFVADIWDDMTSAPCGGL